MGVFAGGSTVLSPEQSRALLGEESLGRLVITPGGVAEVFPVNYAVTAAGNVVFRTAPGGKLAGLTYAPAVVFEVDRVDGDTAWSVIVRGEATVHTESGALTFADALAVHPWVEGDKFEVVEVVVESISGRAFGRGD